MSITIECPKCAKKLKVPDSLAGQQGKCPSCGETVRIPVVTLDPRAEKKPLAESRGYPIAEQETVTIMCPGCSQVLTTPKQAGRVTVKCPACATSVILEDGQVSLPQESPDGPAGTPWHLVTADGQQFGPISDSEIIRWIQEDRVKAGAKVWRKGMPDWMPCEVTHPFMDYCRKPTRADAPYAAYGAPHAIAPTRTSGMAIASLVLGIVGLLIPVFGMVLCLLGVVFAAIAMKEISRDGRIQGRGMAIAGLVTGVIGLALWGLWLIIVASHPQPWNRWYNPWSPW